MKLYNLPALSASVLFASAVVSSGEIKIVAEHNDQDHASAQFKFKNVPSPAKNDAAAKAKITVVEGEQDPAAGDTGKLNDGKLPSESDEPAENFFFNQGTDGGRLLIDLGHAVSIKQINSYSWHTDTRAPQVYKVYGNAGEDKEFSAKPKEGADLEKAGWKLIAKVDTRQKDSSGNGGQYGVSISNSDGPIGKYRYLIFACSQTESDDSFGNTFYSEIDVIDSDAKAEAADISAGAYVIQSKDGKCEISIDTSKAPDLKEWAEQKLAPVLAEWYPKITGMLPSDGYTAPSKFSISIRPGEGVAATGGTRVTANSDWLKQEIHREAIGSLLHEEVHVVQQYGRARRNNPNATRSPGWLVEGIPDYIRWYKYEPESHGAEITKRNFSRAKYDGSYRITANFLNWVVEKYDKDLIQQMNAAMRDGNYTEELWKKNTGKTVQELGDEWHAELEKKLG
jgi:hypothetical protein